MAKRGRRSGQPDSRPSFPEGIRFCFPWRPYQERVLAELSAHLADDRLHVIAPPGSGKTVLGLETLLRLNRPALVLSPTRTIRDQWVDRFVQLFLPEPHVRPDWISTDPRRPGLLTAITYQALHRLHADESTEETKTPEESDAEPEDSPEDEDDAGGEPKSRSGTPSDSAFEGFRQAGVRTLVVDEAHHLRNAWWRSLTALHDFLDRPTVVALTATPPFDVSPAEWARYRSFCGPVDAEIVVPELVIERNLCPHQDYVFLSAPAEAEHRPIREFREAVDAFVADLAVDLDFIEAVALHPWMVVPEDHSEAIFADTAYFSSMLVFLHHVGGRVSPEALEALGVRRDRIPPLDREWLETLL
ncbi:MAG: DEAD/DEAH box helicase family protein, partial [Desulfococcaceae bacterium]